MSVSTRSGSGCRRFLRFGENIDECFFDDFDFDLRAESDDFDFDFDLPFSGSVRGFSRVLPNLAVGEVAERPSCVCAGVE